MLIINLSGLKNMPFGTIYIGRQFGQYKASPLGNPCSARGENCPICHTIHFPLYSTPTPCRSLPCYKKWLWAQIQYDGPVLATLKQLTENSMLGCWCCYDETPLLNEPYCHGHIICRAWDWLTKEKL